MSLGTTTATTPGLLPADAPEVVAAPPAAAPAVAEEPLPQRVFTVAEYERLVAEEFFDPDERLELLEGRIIPKMPSNPPHATGVIKASYALIRTAPPGWHVRFQVGTTTPDSVPEPDVMIVRGEPGDYAQRHPGPGDVALVVEVADSSLARDRVVKRRIYARAAVPAYWIIDLGEGCVDALTQPTGPEPEGGGEPTYRHEERFTRGSRLPLVLDGAEAGAVAVDDLLP